ncbi:MAG: tetratricopeptide repeat protein, partial [Alphaproteobacteria bacterium]
MGAIATSLAPASAHAQSHAPIPVWQGAEAINAAAIEHHNQGYAYARLGYYRPAIDAYNQALALAPTWASAYANRAMAYRQMGETGKALSDIATSIELDRTMVRKWQEWLTRLGYYRGAVDGLHGPMTEQAIMAWAGVPEQA